MAIYPNNPLNADNLPYSGLAVLVFAIIYYFIQKNSYCNTNSALCKNPVLVNSNLEPNEIITNKSTDSISQYIKCDALPAMDIKTYSTLTNKGVAVYAFILTCIFALILYITNKKPQFFKKLMFTTIPDDKRNAYVNPILILFSCVTLIIFITNYLMRGNETISIFLMIIIFIGLSIGAVTVVDNSKSHVKPQVDILLLVVIVVILFVILNFKYIKNLQIGHAFISSSALVTLIIQLIMVVLMGTALADNYNLLHTNPFEYIIYIIIFITILTQFALLCSHIYHCVWKTYSCEADVSVTNDSNEITKVNISCKAKLRINKSITSFIVLAVLFVILPSDWAIDYIIDLFQSIFDTTNVLRDYIVGLFQSIVDVINYKLFD